MATETLAERLIGDLEHGCGVQFGAYRAAALIIAGIYLREAMKDQRHACAESVYETSTCAASTGSKEAVWKGEVYQMVMNTPTPEVGPSIT